MRGLVAILPAILLASRLAAQWDDSVLRPYVMNHRGAGSYRADVSFLLDAPAGKEAAGVSAH